MEITFSKSQLDRLGERLRGDEISGEDLRFLDEYRRSFSEGYEHVVKIIRDEMKLEPTGRPAKSTTSIRDKLRRESIRLSQMQDIAGCRIVVSDVVAQDDAINALIGKLGEMKAFDRRMTPSHGYRAVHLIAHCADRPVEIQVRSALQHMWAELSEKTADIVDPAVKYGSGPEPWQSLLLRLSNLVAGRESLARLQKVRPPDMVEALSAWDGKIAETDIELRAIMEELGSEVQRYRHEVY